MDNSSDNNRPHYDGRYLFWWLALWLLLTVPTQMPECYERSQVMAPVDHISVLKELIGFAGKRSLIEMPFGVIWGALSWLLQWGASSLLNWFRAPGFFQREACNGLWTRMATVILLAFVEAVVLGMPLASMNYFLVNFSIVNEDNPPITITDRSLIIESTGIMLAFPLACLAAGYFGGGNRKPRIVGKINP